MRLSAKLIIKGRLKTKTGLMIGAGRDTFSIGDIDNPVIKTPDGIPYIPGSSLKGKMRSLFEKSYIKNWDIVIDFYQGRINEDNLRKAGFRRLHNVIIHSCSEPNCLVCTVFGRPGEIKETTPTRLYVRDAYLDENTIPEVLRRDYRYTEEKPENSVDRITSAANPRFNERVPAGAEFNFEFVFNIYEKSDIEKFKNVLLTSMKLLEKDYLGSSGSRGYGKIEFRNITVEVTKINILNGKLQIGKEELISQAETLEDLGAELKEINLEEKLGEVFKNNS